MLDNKQANHGLPDATSRCANLEELVIRRVLYRAYGNTFFFSENFIIVIVIITINPSVIEDGTAALLHHFP